MSLESLEEPWGQLVSTENPPGAEEERVPVVGKQFVIGRDKDADLVILDNMFVSIQHCVLLRDEEGEKWVRDLSSNGTLLNGKRLERNKEVKLSDGDLIQVISRNKESDCNVAYKFTDLLLASEETQTGEEEDATLEYDYREAEREDTEKEETEKEEEATEQGATEQAVTVEETSKKEAIGEKRPLKEEDEEEGEATAPSAKKLCVASEEEPAISDTQPTRSEPEGEEAAAAAVKPERGDSIEETLICQICQEIFHDCISLQPCLHSYCSSCYSDWMTHSNKCPACRERVERISKNHLVNNLVNAFLRANPKRKRPEEDLKELDKKNKISKDMLYPKRKHRHYDNEFSDEDSDSSSLTSSDSDSSFTPSPPIVIAAGDMLPGDSVSYISHFAGAVPRIVPFTCRQCPGYMGTRLHPPHAPPPPFTCTLSTNHVLCMCCLQPMPDRRLDTDIRVPPQKCDVCGQAFCHMYWGCTKSGCRGCLELFKDMEFGDGVLFSIVNDNIHESDILKNYLQSHHISVKDMLLECCSKLDSGEYTCRTSRTHRLSSCSRTCYRCTLKNFMDLAYLYRRDLPNEGFPESVTSRPNCHWGRECRTQKHSQDHARRYNHICEQTI